MFRSSASRAPALPRAHPLHPRGRADPDRQHRDQQAAANDRRHGHHPDQEDRPQRDEDQDREQVAEQLRRVPPQLRFALPQLAAPAGRS